MSETTETQKRLDVIEAEIQALKDASSLADTPFSRLFHEARTTSRRRATGVVVQVRVRGGELETRDGPVKTRQGEYLSGTSSWEGKVSLPVKPFMETMVAKQEIIRQLRDLKRNYIARSDDQ